MVTARHIEKGQSLIHGVDQAMDSEMKYDKKSPGSKMEFLDPKQSPGVEKLISSMSQGFALHEIISDQGGLPHNYMFHYVNPAFERMTGLKSAEIIGKTVREIIPGIEEFWIDIYGRVALTGDSVSFENYTDAIGKWFEVTAYSPHKGYFACIFSDITERKKSEEELKLFKAIIDSSREAIVIGRPDGRLVYTNQAHENLFGISGAKAAGKDFMEFFSGNSAEVLKKKALTGLLNGSCWQGELDAINSADKKLRLWMRADAVRDKDNKIRYIFGLMHDVAETRKAQAEKHLAEDRLNSFISNMDDAVYFISLDGRVTFFNPSFFRFSGYARDEFEADPMLWQKLVDHDDLKEILDFLWRQPSNFAFRDIEFRSRHKNGSWRWINNRLTPAFSNSGELIGYNCVGRDITRNKRSETILRLSNKISSIFLTSKPDRLFNDLLGYVLDSFKAKIGFIAYFEDPATPVFLSAVPDNVFKICEVNSKIWEGFNICARAISERRVIFKNSELEFPEGHIIIDNAISVPVVLRDSVIAILIMANSKLGFDGDDIKILKAISSHIAPVIEAHMRTVQKERERKYYEEERDRLESQFRQVQKIEAIGQLAGGMAHDLNNMLSPILGYSELLLADYPENKDIQNGVTEIIRAAERARDLVKNLLAFSSKQVLDLMTEDLNYIISRMERMLRHVIMENIRLDMIFSGYPINITVDRGQIEQIVLNLALNAQDAMQCGGVLSIATSLVFLDKDSLSYENTELKAGSYALLEIRDTGSGMRQEVLEHIFEPFFTTKDVGKGTGLGLATVYGIVKQHKGMITVNSEIGRGSVFRIYLPVSESLASQKKQGPAEKKHGKATEAVIIVEDNEMVRFFVEHVLRRHGFNVLVADSPEKGLSMIVTYPYDIQVMLTDIIMPEMSGRELYEEAKIHKPNLKVIYMTGYGDEVISGQGLLEERGRVIKKPFTIADLVTAVRNTLDA